MAKRNPAEPEDDAQMVEIEVDELSANFDLLYERIVSERTTAWYCYKGESSDRRLLLDPSEGREVWLSDKGKELEERFRNLPDTPQMNREAREFQLDFTRDVTLRVNKSE